MMAFAFYKNLTQREYDKEVVYRFVRELRSKDADFFWGLDSDSLDDFQLEAIVESSLARRDNQTRQISS